MAASGALTEDDLVVVRAGATAGTPVTVWFTAAAVGVPVGGSAKVVAVDEPAEGEFLQVRPAGSRDTMFCSPAELTRTRPARRRAAGDPAPEPAATRPRRSTPRGATEKAATGKGAEEKGAADRDPAPAAPARKAARRKAAAGKGATDEGPAVTNDPAAAGDDRPAAGRRAAARSGAMTVTLRSSAEGEWTVDVLVGKQRVVTGAPVPAADVAAAGRSLPPAVAEAIESSLDEARRRQQERVERLRSELEVAQRVLDRFGS